jgi:hypothetical protein
MVFIVVKILVKAKRLAPGAKEEDDIDEDDCDDDDEDERDEAKKKKPSKISKQLSDLVNIISAVHFHGFDNKGQAAFLVISQ